MIFSMTGYGKAENSENGMNVIAEVHSLNGRFLDVKHEHRNVSQGAKCIV